MRMPTIRSLAGYKSKAGVVTFELTGDDERRHFLPMRLGAINALTVPLIAAAKAVMGQDGQQIAIQPVTLTSARQGVLEDGTPILELGLDGLPVRVAVPPDGLAVLRNLLSELERKTTGPQSEIRH